METQSAFVRSNGAAHLDAETAIDLENSFIINPWNTEHDNTLRFSDTLKNLGPLIFRMIFYERNNCRGYFKNSLVKFFFAGIFCNYELHKPVNLLLNGCH